MITKQSTNPHHLRAFFRGRYISQGELCARLENRVSSSGQPRKFHQSQISHWLSNCSLMPTKVSEELQAIADEILAQEKS